MSRLALLLLFCPVVCVFCGKNSAEKQSAKRQAPNLFEQLPASATGIGFANNLSESKDMNYMNFNYLYISGGAAVGDFDNDGLPDVYFAATVGPNKIYRNKGNFQFDDLSEKAGLGKAAEGVKTGVALVDINGDGWLDIYQCRTGNNPAQRRNLLFLNNKDWTFTEAAAQYGLDSDDPSTQAVFFDYDLDGDLDIYLLNHLDDFKYTTQVRLEEQNGKIVRLTEPPKGLFSDKLYKNNGNGSYTEVGKTSGINNFAFGLSATVMDVNMDGYPDIYVANDYIEPDMLYVNNRNGTFSDRINDYVRHTSAFSMGADCADVNNDGLLDLYVLDMALPNNAKNKMTMTAMTNERYHTLAKYGYGQQMMRNVLQLNNGNGTFSEIGCLAGIDATDWSWSPLMADFDNDGWCDIFVSNGFRRDVTNLDYIHFTFDSTLRADGGRLRDTMTHIQKVPKSAVANFMFRNKGDLCFEDVSEPWGFGEKTYSNGAVYADFDNDGDLDIIVVRAESPAAVFRNKTIEGKQGGNYLQVKLAGPPQNPSGVGAVVVVETGGLRQAALSNPVRGYISTCTDLLHYGLGSRSAAERVSVQWPDGKVQALENVQANQRLTLHYADAKKGPPIWPVFDKNSQLFTNASAASGINFTHQENAFFDFDRERLLPRKYSNLGPALAVGDLNGDGLDDFFIGGAFTHFGAVCLQLSNGKFVAKSEAFATDSLREDVGAAFFDADGDGDLDLYVVSGGNEAPLNSVAYQDRLYFNDGKGNFKPALPTKLPEEGLSGSCVAPFDFDGDGDLDLFVGGRVSPGNYPSVPYSMVLRNEGDGRFTRATGQVAPELEQIGMVTAIQFADLDRDGKAEMIVTGEWMPIEVFKYADGKYSRATQNFGLENTQGWWNCLIVADFDGDGDLDFVAGNEGLNTRYRASEKEPLQLFAKDFDSNGSMDPLLAFYENGACYPFALRDPLLKQIPSLKKKFVRYSTYSKARIEDLYPMDLLKKGIYLRANELRSCYFENNGGKFTPKPLPNEAQTAPVKAGLAHDFDGDGRLDLLLVGNDYGPAVEVNRYDAGNGTLLLGAGKGQFRPVPNYSTGFWAPHEARNLALVRMAGGKMGAMVANNSSAPQVFVLRRPKTVQ